MYWSAAAATLVLFGLSSLRHWSIRSTAWDLAFFDQALFLISRGQSPVVSIAGFHAMGDHASWILYPLAAFYWIQPSVYWLFALQAAALAGAAIPLWLLLARDGLSRRAAAAVLVAYFFYPMVFDVNLFDFHPDVFAVPALFGAVLAARTGRVGWFVLCLVVIAGCKDVLAFAILGLGIWLLLFEVRRQPAAMVTPIRAMGALALAVGVAWLLIATQVIIPGFHGPNPARGRYDYLGRSFGDILITCVRHPGIVLSHLVTQPNARYAVSLLAPIAWGLKRRYLAPLIGALPIILLNALSTLESQRTLQYSIAVVPFLFLAAGPTLSLASRWRRPIVVIAWALVAFGTMVNFQGIYVAMFRAERVESRNRVTAALRLIRTDGGVLTTNDIAPHVSERREVYLAIRGFDENVLQRVDYVLLNVQHPGLYSSPQFAASLVTRLQGDRNYCERYALGDVHLFQRTGAGCGARIP